MRWRSKGEGYHYPASYIIVGGGAVTSFDVDSVPNSHVIGRHVIVPETGRHVEQVGGVAAQLVDHVFKRLEAGFMR